MAALNLGSGPQPTPRSFPELIEHLASRPQPAVVYYHGSTAERVELSGRVLANWTVKLVGLLREETEITAGGVVVLDMPSHWKAAALWLACMALDTEVHLGQPHTSRREPDLVLTDQPLAWVNSDELADAELAAVSGGMVDSSFTEATGHQLPAWVLDVSAEVRQQPDQLLQPLEQVPLPVVDSSMESPLVLTTWTPDTAAQMAALWAEDGVVVLFHGPPHGQVWEQMLRNEAATYRSSR
ncbi:TIGR03089 family protein [Nesterenkonia alba]|uniref:TIGR03089 family protein n=1 Tax=Nesterenkonia alba TaxID=515814 RepID=UPI0012EB6CC4|nr:TIGR03089 family protein [Nesterenkonia alba]